MQILLTSGMVQVSELGLKTLGFGMTELVAWAKNDVVRTTPRKAKGTLLAFFMIDNLQ